MDVAVMTPMLLLGLGVAIVTTVLAVVGRASKEKERGQNQEADHRDKPVVS